MIRDRGTMKWTAMMLPEHLMLLKAWKQEMLTELPREHAEWELEELQQTITQAFTQHNYIMLTIWEHGNYVQWGGTIQAMNKEATVTRNHYHNEAHPVKIHLSLLV